MAKAIDRTAFLSDPTRFKIAEFCIGEWRSLEEIARRLGRASGSLSQPRTMHKRKVLEAKTRQGADDRGGTTVFRLNPAWQKALAIARTRQRPELPTTGQDLLLIPLADTPAACKAIPAGIMEVEWAAQLVGESFGLLVAPSPDATGASTMRVLEALGVAGQQIRRLHLKEVMSPARLHDWSRTVAAPRPGNELPPGG